MSSPSAETAARGFLDAAMFDPDATPEIERPILNGLICQGELVVWIGREKHRKSNLVLQAAMCMALGRLFLNFAHGTGTPLRVVYMDFESKQASMKRRYEGICNALGLTEADKAVLKEHLEIVLVREFQKNGGRVPRFPVRCKDPDEMTADQWWKRFAREYPAEVYVFDPMRTLHAQDENDSNIEMLLTRLREVFQHATLIIPHHMTKGSATSMDHDGSALTLATPGRLRAFANGGRGSSAVNAHADVVVCQERRVESEIETLRLGAYMKDSADVEPIALVESNHESFFWLPSASLPEHLRRSFELLRLASRAFTNEADAVSVLTGSQVPRSTAYRHVKELRDCGLLIRGEDDGLSVATEPKP